MGESYTMTTYCPPSHSPRVSERASSRVYDHVTPVHSPHHSVTSSISLRTPIHTLTIHEYRKQQHTPNSQEGTPAGKTLRRKPAAAALNEIERAPSTTQPTRSGSGSSLRPIQFSRSAYQLKPSQPPFQQQAAIDLSFRSQSAEPRVQTGSISSISTASSSGKLCYFKSRKRLPKPPAATGPVLSHPPLANVKSTQSWHSPPPVALSLYTEHSHSSGPATTPTPSTFSLSRFPQPPHLIVPPFSPPPDEGDSTHKTALDFVNTSAPVTPPATPAIIHYRGTSFDLVNPHDSLVLHDIVTPSRDFDSSEYISLRTSEEMAPKRAVYGDFRAAHAGILRRPEDSLSNSNVDLPQLPTPAAVSPNSSSYTSPMYSPESDNVPSPLVIKKTVNDSRFSLKELTRNLTRKLGKSPSKADGEELQDMRDRSVSKASISMDGEYPRSLTRTYVATPQTAYFPLSPSSPMTPTSPTSPEGMGAFSPGEDELEFPRRHRKDCETTEPLASMIPDDPSTQVGRFDDTQLLLTEEGGLSKPYYDDLDSIYPSSSIYTGDGRRKSNYQQSLSSNRQSQSNPFARYSGIDANNSADEYHRDSLHGYNSPKRANHQVLRPLTRETYGRSVEQEDPKTDTISELIDEYKPSDTTDMLLDWSDRPQQARATSGLSQFDFDLRQNPQPQPRNYVSQIQRVAARRPTITQNPGSPPREAAPLAPAFEYDELPFMPRRPGTSGIFSQASDYSYGDTRNLLQISQSGVSGPAPSLEPSSSYSQPETQPLKPSSSYSQPVNKQLEPSSSYSQTNEPQSPQTPKAALEEAERIFQDTVTSHRQGGSEIPAMWARHNSGSQLLSRTCKNQSFEDAQEFDTPTVGADRASQEEKAEWETIGTNNRESRGHESLGSIADYSSSEGTRDSLGPILEGSPYNLANPNHSREPSNYYGHPSPIHDRHPNPFNSSPPELKARVSARTAPDTPSPPLAASPPASKTTPLFRFSNRPENVLGRGAVEQPYAFSPWADPYAFSDKETQELLASGPNDNIIVEDEAVASDCQSPASRQRSSTADESVFDSPVGLERENTFEKLCVVGPKGNLTGTPRGTGMHETGSSVADTSSPGLRLSSSVGRHSFRSDYSGFYASPFPARGSVTRIRPSRPPINLEFGRTPSETTLFPREKGLETVQETSPLPGARHHLRNSTTFLHTERRTSRSAVPGQTKLRHMFLAPEGRSISTQGTHVSHFKGGSDRPSTSDTNTPLRPSHLSIDTYPATMRSAIAHEHSPHLLCVERELNAEDEARRRKLSWFILAAFCILPPCIILFRFYGDSVIAMVTKGRLGHCTPQSKRTALIAGIAVNVGLVTAILVPILVAHALKAV